LQPTNLGKALIVSIIAKYPEKPLRGVVRKSDTIAVNFYKNIGARECDFVEKGHDANFYQGMMMMMIIEE